MDLFMQVRLVRPVSVSKLNNIKKIYKYAFFFMKFNIGQRYQCGPAQWYWSMLTNWPSVWTSIGLCQQISFNNVCKAWRLSIVLTSLHCILCSISLTLVSLTLVSLMKLIISTMVTITTGITTTPSLCWSLRAGPLHHT